MTNRKTLTTQLRDAVEHCGVTRYELAKQTNVSESVLSRFVRGQRGLTLATADRLVEQLGLELVPRAPR